MDSEMKEELTAEEKLKIQTEGPKPGCPKCGNLFFSVKGDTAYCGDRRLLTGCNYSGPTPQFFALSSAPPKSVELVSYREPTPDEIRRGLELQTMAEECLARNRCRAPTTKAEAQPCCPKCGSNLLHLPIGGLSVRCGSCGVYTLVSKAMDRFSEYNLADFAQFFPGVSSAPLEGCADCAEARKLANSDATTPGFFHPYCSKHKPLPYPPLEAKGAGE